MKHRPPPSLLSDRKKLRFRHHFSFAEQLSSRLSYKFFRCQSNGGDNGPNVSGVELFQEAKAPTVFRYLHKNTTGQPVRPGTVV